MTAFDLYIDRFPLTGNGMLCPGNGRRRFDGSPENDFGTIAHAAQNAAGVIGGLGDMTGCIGSKCIIVDRTLRPGS